MLSEGLSATHVRTLAVRGAISVGVRNILVRVINLVAVVVLARLLAPSAFGLLAFGLTLKGLSALAATGGLAAGLVRRKESPTQAELSALTFFQLTVSSALVVALALAGLVFGEAATIAAIMCLALPISVFRVPSAIVLERRLDWSLLAKAEVVESLVYVVAAIVAVLAGAGVWGVAGATVVGAAAGTAIISVAGPVGFVRPRRRAATIGPLLRFGAKFQAVAVTATFRDQGLNLVVAAAGGVTILGLWSVVNRLFEAVRLLLQSLFRVSYSAMARALEAGDEPGRLVGQVLRVSTTIVGLPALLLAGTAPDLVHVIFGAQWSPAADALPWGAAALICSGPISTACAGFLQARGDLGRFLAVVLAQSLMWFAATVLLVPRFDTAGVGMAMLVGAIVYAIGIGFVMRRHARFPIVRLMWAPVAAAASGAAVAFAATDVIESHVLGLVAGVPLGALAYVALLSLLRRSDLRMLAALFRRGRSSMRAGA